MGIGAAAAELEGPDCPDELVYIWEIFAGFPRETATKPSVTWSELAAWQAIAGVQLTPFEASCLFALDAAAVRILAPAIKGPRPK